VTVLDDADYHVRSPPCHVCLAAYANAKVQTSPKGCFACQESLETEALFPTIVEKALLIAGSAAYNERPLGFVIVLGRSVVGCGPLVELANGLVFYIVQELPSIGKMRHLSSLGHWNWPTTGAYDATAVRIEEVLSRNDHHLWLLFEHYRYADERQKRIVD
jgi:hypothetical protein